MNDNSSTLQNLTIVLMLELIAGAKEFKLGFSAMNLSEEQMASSLKVSSLTRLS